MAQHKIEVVLDGFSAMFVKEVELTVSQDGTQIKSVRLTPPRPGRLQKAARTEAPSLKRAVWSFLYFIFLMHLFIRFL